MKKIIIITLLLILNININAQDVNLNDENIIYGIGVSNLGNLIEADSLAFLSLSKTLKVIVTNNYEKKIISHNDTIVYSNLKHIINVNSDIEFNGVPIKQNVITNVNGSIEVIRWFNKTEYLSEVNMKIDSLTNMSNINKYIFNDHKKSPYRDGNGRNVPHFKSIQNLKYTQHYLLNNTMGLYLGGLYQSYMLLNNDIMDVINPNNFEKKIEIIERVKNIYNYDESIYTFVKDIDGKKFNNPSSFTEEREEKRISLNKDTVFLSISKYVEYEYFNGKKWVSIDKRRIEESGDVTHIIHVENNRFDSIPLRIPFLFVNEYNEIVRMNVSEEWYPIRDVNKSIWYSEEGLNIYNVKMSVLMINRDYNNGLIDNEYKIEVLTDLQNHLKQLNYKAKFVY